MTMLLQTEHWPVDETMLLEMPPLMDKPKKPATKAKKPVGAVKKSAGAAKKSTVLLPDALRRKLREYAGREDTSLQAILVTAATEFLAKRGIKL